MSEPRTAPRFVQIACSESVEDDHLYALDEDGRVWEYSGGTWANGKVVGRGWSRKPITVSDEA